MGTRWAQGTGASWRLGIEGCCCAAAPPPSPRVSWASPRGVPWWPGVCQPLGGAAQGLERAEQGLAGDLRQPLGPTLWFLPSVLPCLPQCSQGPPPPPWVESTPDSTHPQQPTVALQIPSSPPTQTKCIQGQGQKERCGRWGQGNQEMGNLSLFPAFMSRPLSPPSAASAKHSMSHPLASLWELLASPSLQPCPCLPLNWARSDVMCPRPQLRHCLLAPGSDL